ncbi:MAG: peptidyl-prolyl cis-trans isomerase [Pseudomonadales bacterium]|jgi:hypothetical protein|nr:peptidyl-prolyl cis-trans isomerase [Gammaproteobacteria bacterium]MBP6050525.1 peptidyl-prolyl cis-trans isomerase [Pseudomonadales bacterium]MBK6582571.1 peptidyl-prolyl cis-trans isomerase [Gammaproteobacteria bacterium]MBK7169004.1 peptidyl-prolyl cis-trans isomerase [Gammaproteobacteria bacterium]MBK7521163.1 peptidyl-prolyl cis-trans isomerase [Gammaproteobacteria bacterium]
MAEPATRLGCMLRYKPLHFLLGGLLLFVLLDPGAARQAPLEPLRLDQARIDLLRSSWSASMGQEPDEAELGSLVRRELDDEILFREALQRSLHELDPVVRQRVLLNMRFLGAGADADDETLFREALKLGMHRNDVVVRRRLVQIMEMSIEDGADRSPATDAEIAAMYERRREELLIPARWRITQVYFSSDRRGARAPADAAVALESLAGQSLAPAQAVGLGDPFLGGHQLPLLSIAQLAGQFGDAFATALGNCAVHAWCGPLSSSFGAHLVWVEESIAAREPSSEEPEVRKRLVADVLRERSEHRLAEAMVILRRKYGAST